MSSAKSLPFCLGLNVLKRKGSQCDDFHFQCLLRHRVCSSCFVFAMCCFDDNVNTLRPRQNGRRFADDTFKRIFLNENVRISIKISLKFVPKGPINNIPALVQILAWRRSGDKPLSEPMMVSLLTHICVTRPQWVKYQRVISCDIFLIVFLYNTFKLKTNKWISVPLFFALDNCSNCAEWMWRLEWC